MSSPIILPKYFLTADDRRGVLVVNIATGLSFVWVACLTRLFQRVQLREWKSDDWLLMAALLSNTVHSGILFHLFDLGLGLSPENIADDQLRQLNLGEFAAQIIYICTLYFAKCSALCLYLRLAPRGFSVVTSWILIAASTIWMAGAIVLIALPCRVKEAYEHPYGCSSRWSRWQAITAGDVITEILIFLIAIQLFWGIQLRLRVKLIAILTFAARLPVIIAAAVRLYYLDKRIRGESYLYNHVIASQWQMAIAIIASVVTGLGLFLRPFSRNSLS